MRRKNTGCWRNIGRDNGKNRNKVSIFFDETKNEIYFVQKNFSGDLNTEIENKSEQ